MNVITKFSALGLAAVLFAACSDSSSDNGDGNLTPEITGIGLTTTGGSTVTNYKVGNVAKAPRRAFGISMPAETKAPADAKDITTLSGSVIGQAVVVPAKGNYTVSNAATFNNCTIYVSDRATLNFEQIGSGNTIIVNNGGTLNHTGEKAIQATVVNYGTFNQESGKALEISGAFYTNSNLSLAKSNSEIIVNNGTLYVNGTLRAKKLTNNQSGKIDLTGNLDMTDADIESTGYIHVGGHLNANNITLAGGENIVDKYVLVKKSLTMSQTASLQTNSLDASSKKDDKGNLLGNIITKMSDGSSITVSEAGYLTFDTFEAKGSSKVEIKGNNGVAVFKARKFAYDKETVALFSTPSVGATFMLELSEMTLNGKTVAFEDAVIDASYYDYAQAQKQGIEQAKFDEEVGYKMNKTDFEKLPKLDLISTVTNNSNDYMSATCIAPVDNKLYVSYHTRGTQHGASIEVFNVSGNDVSVKQTLKDNDNALDFNHCMVANSKLYLSGSHINAGGGFAYIDIKSDGTLNTTSTTIDGKTREPLQFVSLDNLASTTKVDANWAAMFQGNLIVATTAGYKAYTLGANGPVLANTVATAGKAKSLAVSNDGNTIYGLSFKSATNDDATPVEGWLQYTTDATMGGNLSTVELGNIAPTNGKNSLFADKTSGSNVLYACLGQYGVKEINGSSWTWTIPVNKYDKAKGYANGVASDDNYVYVACGGYGLVVLDKATGKELCHRTVGASANYVAVNNGYIYVANGLNRVQVFKLNYTAK